MRLALHGADGNPGRSEQGFQLSTANSNDNLNDVTVDDVIEAAFAAQVSDLAVACA